MGPKGKAGLKNIKIRAIAKKTIGKAIQLMFSSRATIRIKLKINIIAIAIAKTNQRTQKFKLIKIIKLSNPKTIKKIFISFLFITKSKVVIKVKITTEKSPKVFIVPIVLKEMSLVKSQGKIKPSQICNKPIIVTRAEEIKKANNKLKVCFSPRKLLTIRIYKARKLKMFIKLPLK